MTKCLLLLGFLVGSASAQTQRDTTDDEMLINVVYPQPELIGGFDTLRTLIQYPDVQGSVEGRVLVQFHIDAEGRTSDAEIVRGLGAAFDAEALRVVSLLRFHMPEGMPPGSIPVPYSLPITFRRSRDSPE